MARAETRPPAVQRLADLNSPERLLKAAQDGSHPTSRFAASSFAARRCTWKICRLRAAAAAGRRPPRHAQELEFAGDEELLRREQTERLPAASSSLVMSRHLVSFSRQTRVTASAEVLYVAVRAKAASADLEAWEPRLREAVPGQS